MKNRKNKMLNSVTAFTLIELLIAVLIIGILAAVAIPQYQQAVLKSRYKTLMLPAKTIHSGNEVYFMANGFYADKLTDLDVDIPQAVENIQVQLSDNEEHAYVLASRDDIANNYIMYQSHSVNYPNEIHCEALTDDVKANQLCKILGGQEISGSITEGYTTYVLEGTGNGLYTDNTTTTREYCANGICASFTANSEGEIRKSCKGSSCSLVKYDSNGNIISSGWCEEDTCEESESYEYDSNGNILSVQRDHGEKIIFNYDDDGKIISSTACWENDCSVYRYYEYNDNGNLVARGAYCASVAPDGSCAQITKDVNYYYYTYNPDGSITEHNYSYPNYSAGYDSNWQYLNPGYQPFYDDTGHIMGYESCWDGGCNGKYYQQYASNYYLKQYGL